jgi:hypothetical protein
MTSVMKVLIIPILMLAFSGRALPGDIDITAETFHTVLTGQTVTVDFGVWNYGVNNPGVSPYPTQVGFSAIGVVPESGQTLPGSTPVYFPGYLFEAFLEALDGSVSMPLHDSSAGRLGLGSGYLVATLGTFSASGSLQQVGVLSGSVSIPLAVSEALFGTNLNNYNNAARIRLVNQGLPFLRNFFVLSRGL